MLRAMRAILYKIFCISLLCSFVTRLKRVLGLKGTSSQDVIASRGKEGEGDDAGEETGDWGSWDSSEPMSIEVTGQKAVPAQGKVYSSKVQKTPDPTEPPPPEVNFFGDMEPVIAKPNQKLRVKARSGSGHAYTGYASGSRFAFKEPGTSAELEAWDDDKPASAWDEDVLDETEADAISAEAKKQKRDNDRLRRQQEQDQRRSQQEQKRQDQLQRKQLGMKIS